MYVFNSAASNALNVGTITVSPPTGSLIIVSSATSAGGGTPTVTFSDNSTSTWVNASNNVVLSGIHYSVGYCLAALAGVTTITATYNGGLPGTVELAAIIYTGMTSPSFVAISAPNVQVSPGATANAVTAAALACGAVNALLLGISIDVTASNSGLSAGTGFTSRYNNGNNLNTAFEDPNAEVTGSQTATWTATTHGTDTYGSIAIAFADNTGGGGGASIAWVT